MMKRYLMFMLLILCSFSLVTAQADCPALVDAAFNATNELCADLGRNQACYGNLLLSATPREDVAAFSFEQAGDRVPVADIQSLQLSAMSLSDETWGVALMLLQANLPDTLPGQNVTMLLFGDVNVTNAVDTQTELLMTATGNVNVRLRPRTDQNNVIASLTRGQEVVATGRLADNTWIRVVVEGDARGAGWVSADFLTTDGDINALSVVEPDEPTFNVMQAFYFASGIGDSRCSEAPDSGILIQTPQGAGEINLRVNEVDVRLGSTVFLTAGSGFMNLYVVEGQATVSSGGVSQTVPAGTFTEIPLDGNGLANGAPTFPQPYDMTDVRALPVAIALPQSVSIAQPLPADAIGDAIDTAEGLPASGVWSEAAIVLASDCPPNPIPLGSTGGAYYVYLTFSPDRSTFTFEGYSLGILTFTRIAENVYTSSFPEITLTMTFHSATSYTLAWRMVGNGGCVYSQDATGTYVRSN